MINEKDITNAIISKRRKEEEELSRQESTSSLFEISCGGPKKAAPCCASSASHFPPQHIQCVSFPGWELWLLHFSDLTFVQVTTTFYMIKIREFTKYLHSQQYFCIFVSYLTAFQFPLVAACLCHFWGCSCSSILFLSSSFLYNLPWLYFALSCSFTWHLQWTFCVSFLGPYLFNCILWAWFQSWTHYSCF